VKVAELKLVVDANAAEMRAGFADTKTEFARVRRAMREIADETRRHFDVVAENIISRVELILEGFDARVDQKIAACEQRLTRKFSKR